MIDSPTRYAGFGIAVWSAALLAGAWMPARAPAAETRPNLVVIVADDLGNHDPGFQGGTEIPTPRLDALAASGVRCTQGYVTCPVCSPTRAGLITGRYQQRFGHEHNPGPPQQTDGREIGLPTSEVTLANRLREAGYRTGLVGKWHLGSDPKYRPLARGFDEFFGFLGGAHSYLDWTAGSQRGMASILRGDVPVSEDTYLTEALGREAAAFVERQAKNPFFLLLTFNAVHTPLEATDKYRARFPQIADEKHRNYAAMLSAMDDAVGQVLDALQAQQLEEQTLVFFISDNGGPQGNTSSNLPLRGYKAQLFEGGIRVPYLVSWPGHLPSGQTYERPVSSLDLVPTALALAGVEIEDSMRLDGVNLLPYLEGETDQDPHATLYWRFGPGSAAVRHGDWKLIRQSAQPDQLYDLAADLSETRNQATAEPERLAELSKLLAAWESQLEEPRWGRQGGGARRGRRARAAVPAP